MRFIIPSLVAWVAATAVSAHATTLTFEGLSNGSIGATSNTGFGDRVTVAGAGLNLGWRCHAQHCAELRSAAFR
ncbi:hypothetical protein [uncultured Aquabacterium sp.]|uniref:hypothetical protein n=1 Tax=uncultured Aquabacterium sp. TaxID=158753 RepID=UPI0030CA7DC3|tara:strand:+ start:1617 stop:1838 length:222 start_codon:yes stop_codon:yes gene_type:complete